MRRVVIIHMHDPAINHVGGLGTYINTFLKYAPADFEVSLVGVSTDPAQRPVGKWQKFPIEGKEIDFFPLLNAHPTFKSRFPLSIRFTRELARYKKELNLENAILELHRIEPELALRDVKSRKVLFYHTHSQDLYNPKTEVFWKYFPWLYFWLEDRLIGKMDQLYSVRQDQIEWYRARRPQWKQPFYFLPTWVDDEVFKSHPEETRRQFRKELAQEYGFNPEHQLLLFVGRFESQKDPVLLLESFRELQRQKPGTRLVMVGGGSMEGLIRSFIAEHNLPVTIVAPQKQAMIAKWMNASDVLALASAFEGMPRVVVESLQSGLPAVAYDEGETHNLLSDPHAGALVAERTPAAFAAGFARVLDRTPDRQACQRAASPFTAEKILSGLFEKYRQLQKEKA